MSEMKREIRIPVNGLLIIEKFKVFLDSKRKEHEENLFNAKTKFQEREENSNKLQNDKDKYGKEIEDLEKMISKAELKTNMLNVKLETLKHQEIEKYKNIELLKEDIANAMSEEMREREKFDGALENAKKTFSALNAAMSYFKQYVRCYIHLESSESQIFSFIFFYNASVDIKDHKYYVKLESDGENWRVHEMRPSIPHEKEVVAHLESTGDIIHFISHLRKVYVERAKKEKNS